MKIALEDSFRKVFDRLHDNSEIALICVTMCT
jgi:hypothetical protein